MATAAMRITVTSVLLALTREEAVHLERLLVNHIVGYDDGPRGVFSGIAEALTNTLDIPHDTNPFKLKDGEKCDRLFLLPD